MIDKYFSDEQMQVIYSAIDAAPSDPKMIMLEVLAMTGMRGDELTRLKFSDLNLTLRRLTIRRGSKGSDARTCALSIELTIKLAKLQDALNLSHDALLISSFSKGTAATALRSIRQVLDVIKARHFPGQTLPGIHGLRHTKAVRAVRAGHDIYMVKHLLGHKAISSTEHYFPRVNEEILNKIQEKR